MSTAPTDFNARVIAEFRANEGRVGGQFEGMPLLLLHTLGARSGGGRTTPLVYLRDGDRYVIFASKAGAPTHPAWYHNLRAHPEVTIEVGTQTLEAVAADADGAERERLIERQLEASPTFGSYLERTTRRIPAVVLTPRPS